MYSLGYEELHNSNEYFIREKGHNIHPGIFVGIRRRKRRAVAGNQKHIIGQPAGVICLTVFENAERLSRPRTTALFGRLVHPFCRRGGSYTGDPYFPFRPDLTIRGSALIPRRHTQLSRREMGSIPRSKVVARSLVAVANELLLPLSSVARNQRRTTRDQSDQKSMLLNWLDLRGRH